MTCKVESVARRRALYIHTVIFDKPISERATSVTVCIMQYNARFHVSFAAVSPAISPAKARTWVGRHSGGGVEVRRCRAEVNVSGSDALTPPHPKFSTSRGIPNTQVRLLVLVLSQAGSITASETRSLNIRRELEDGE